MVFLVISDMLRFSDCKNESACGYSEYMSPRKPAERSITLVYVYFFDSSQICLGASNINVSCIRLTAISTSLLCEATAAKRIVCGGLTFLIQSLLREWQEKDIDTDGLIDLVSLPLLTDKVEVAAAESCNYKKK